MVGRKITIIASPLLKEWKLKKLIGRDGVIIKENQTQKTKGVWVRLNEPDRKSTRLNSSHIV